MLKIIPIKWLEIQPIGTKMWYGLQCADSNFISYMADMYELDFLKAVTIPRSVCYIFCISSD